jgi:type VI secretion system lysozyme-like protein
MGGLRRIEGAPAPLFDRLAEPEGDGPASGAAGLASGRMLDRAGLLASVARELEHLLSSRAGLPADALDRRRRTSVEYGIPDLSAFTLDGHGPAEMARRIGDAIAAYEPRLANPHVTVDRDPARRDGAIVRIEGAIVLGPVMEPVSFRLPLGGNGTGSSDGG